MKPITINGVVTRATRYKGRDGKERAVLYWRDYDWLLKRLKAICKSTRELGSSRALDL